jgi:hypothetical protein
VEWLVRLIAADGLFARQAIGSHPAQQGREAADRAGILLRRVLVDHQAGMADMERGVGDVHRGPADAARVRVIGLRGDADDTLGIDVGPQRFGGGHQAIDAAVALAAVDQVGPVNVTLHHHVVPVDGRPGIGGDADPLAAARADRFDDVERRRIRALREGLQRGAVGWQDEALREPAGGIDRPARREPGRQMRLVRVGRPLVEILGIIANDKGRGGLAGFAAKHFVEVAQVVIGLDRPAGVAQGGGQALERQRNFGTGGLGLHQQALIDSDRLLGAPETMRQEGGHAHGARAREHLECLVIGREGRFGVAERQGAKGEILQSVAVAGL